MIRKRSELLALLDQRYKALGLGEARPYKKPELSSEQERQAEIATRAWKNADNSDPFAAARIAHYQRQGYIGSDEVLADARNLQKSHKEGGIFIGTI